LPLILASSPKTLDTLDFLEMDRDMSKMLSATGSVLQSDFLPNLKRLAIQFLDPEGWSHRLDFGGWWDVQESRSILAGKVQSLLSRSNIEELTFNDYFEPDRFSPLDSRFGVVGEDVSNGLGIPGEWTRTNIRPSRSVHEPFGLFETQMKWKATKGGKLEWNSPLSSLESEVK